MTTDLIMKLINELPQGTELSSKNITNIHRLFPVPLDFKVLWASVEAFGGHPSGIVVTDKALIIKSTSTGVKTINKARESKKAGTKKSNSKLHAIYQIILWEHFDVGDFRVFDSDDGTYTVEYATTTYPHFSKACFANKFIEQANIKHEASRLSYQSAVDVAQNSTLGLENIIFTSQYGSDTSSIGHGIFAEEAGAILDKLSNESVEVVGRDNAKDGPDKNVNGSPVQCKYWKTPAASLRNCFKPNAAGVKEYRYYDLGGNPMKVEVPKDQYSKAIELMQKRILDGQVPGVSDPKAAYDIIRKGKLTYAQARNLAKAGTIESLTYDAATGAVNCTFAFGLSALTTFAFALRQTKDPKKAAEQAAIVGLQTFGLSLGTQILATQIARTGLQKTLIPATDLVAQKLGSKTVQNLINSMRTLAGENPIYGAAAQKSFAKAIRANIIAQSITLVVFSVPDTIRIARGKISGAEYAKNISSLFASLCGAGLGSMSATRLVAKIAHKIPNPLAKTIVFVGSAAIGAGAGVLARKGITIFREDDGAILNRMFDAAIINTCIDYMFDEVEVDKFLELLFKDKDMKRKLQLLIKNLFSTKKQYLSLQAILDTAAHTIAMQRPMLTVSQEPDENALLETLTETIGEAITDIAEEEMNNESD